MITEFLVAEGERIKRLDAFLVSRERSVSRSGLQRLILAGRIRVNADVVRPSRKIKPGDRITIEEPKPGPMLRDKQSVPLEILYEDESLIIIDKPSGVVVHPTSGNWNGTLLNALLDHFQSNGKVNGLNAPSGLPGLIHRLDKETSGVMVISKTKQAQRTLGSQFEAHSIVRTYEALVHGRPTEGQGTIRLSIGRDVHDEKKVSSNTRKPQMASTEFNVMQSFGNVASRLALIPYTGRQHQLRVHLASLGCPILGDQLYGCQKDFPIQEKSIPRMMLYARSLSFCHPVSKEWVEFNSNQPPEFETMVTHLENQFTQPLF